MTSAPGAGIPLDANSFRDYAGKLIEALVTEFEPSAWPSTLQGDVERSRALQQRLYNEGLTRAGWPIQYGGFGGSAILRAIVAELVAENGLLTTNSSTVLAFAEILGPAFVKFARSELREEVFQAFLAGKEQWCQGFSEPGAGSDLASLQTTAAAAGRGWIINGSKVWTSLAQFAQRGVVLARTGARDSRHRGISAFLIDMGTPGIEVRPLVTIGGRSEFSELFFTDVQVPADRIIGNEGDGWPFAMSVLPNERGAMMWQESAMLAVTFAEAISTWRTRLDARAVGNAFLDLCGLRARSRQTQQAIAADRSPGVESSIDKILDTVAHQSIFDLARDYGTPEFLIGADDRTERWRDEFFYSRAASIYGGTAEIQRNLIAQRLLGMPRD